MSGGSTIPLTDPGTMVIYCRRERSWQPEREIPFFIEPDKGLKELRRKMTDLHEFLGSCRIFVAKSASGALYYELEKAGCSIWEISGRPEEFLDEVLEEEERKYYDEKKPLAIPSPLEVSPGRYFISIKDIQGNRPDITSKQILQQFVHKEIFLELEMICDHLPPWIEMEADCRGYSLKTERLGNNDVKVTMLKKSP